MSVLRRLVLALAIVVTPVTAVTAGGSWRTPRLEVTDRSPVVVRGSGFAPAERVRVRATAGDRTRTERVRAGRRGGFVATFDGFAVDRCEDDLYLRARGSRGGRAEAKLPQLQCPPPLGPGAD